MMMMVMVMMMVMMPRMLALYVTMLLVAVLPLAFQLQRHVPDSVLTELLSDLLLNRVGISV